MLRARIWNGKIEGNVMIQHGNGSVYRGGYKGFKYEGKGKLTHKFDSKIHQDHKEKFAAGQGV